MPVINCPKLKLPLSAVSRRGGLAKACSFHMVPFPALQTGPFRRYGAERYEARGPILFGATVSLLDDYTY